MKTLTDIQYDVLDATVRAAVHDFEAYQAHGPQGRAAGSLITMGLLVEDEGPRYPGRGIRCVLTLDGVRRWVDEERARGDG